MSNIKKTNSRLLFLGLGGVDAKSNVATLLELENLISDFTDFYQEDDIVWVVAEKSFYVAKPTSTPPYEIYSSGSGGGGGTPSDITIHYGKETEILGFLQGDQSKAPSLLGYSDGDGFISSREVSSGNITIKKFDIYEAYVPAVPTGIDPEAYNFIGSMQGVSGTDGADGNDGSQGDKGAQGDKGDSFTVDQQGLLADLNTGCEAHPDGWSFLATDTGDLYFKESTTGPNDCVWSPGVPFGKGEPGETTYSTFRRELESNPPAAPAPGTLHPATSAGWFDAPPTTVDPLQRLWITKTRYSTATSLANIIWSQPIMIDGEAGLDGLEGVNGKNAGYWVVWSELENPSLNISVKPIIDGGGIYSIDLSGDTDWYDDVGLNTSPKWSAQISYDPNTDAWDVWAYTKMTGESPPYMIDLYQRAASVPATPTTTLEYINSGTGTFTTGAEAAVLVGNNWTDAPTGSGDLLYVTRIYLRFDGVDNNVWSTPAHIDGVEGVSAGIWVIWSDNALNNKPAAPPPVESLGPDLIDLAPPWQDDVDNPVIDAKWSATSYLNTGTGVWSAWAIVQIKGEDGQSASDERTYVPVEVATYGLLGILVFDTMQEALDESSNIEIAGQGITHYHNGGTSGNFPPPAVGNNLFEDSLGTIPYQFGTEKFIVFVDYVASPYSINIINYAKISQSGTILGIYNAEEAAASIPSPILGYSDIIIPTWYQTDTTHQINTNFRSPAFVQLLLKCTGNITTGGRQYVTGSMTSLPAQHTGSESLQIKGPQVTWIYDSNVTTVDFRVSVNEFKIYNADVSWDADGVPMNSQFHNFFDLVLRVFY